MDKEDKKNKSFDPTQDLSKAPRKELAKRGINGAAKLLTEHQIREAQKKARSSAECARLLGVSYNTYKKYAERYGIFGVVKNPSGLGIPKPHNVHSGKYSIDDLIAGKYPNYPVWKLKKRLISSGYLEEKCSNCGFEERRITDYKVPLKLEFKDGDKTNHKYENLELLCYNCSFLMVGNIVGLKVDHKLPDDDDEEDNFDIE